MEAQWPSAIALHVNARMLECGIGQSKVDLTGVAHGRRHGGNFSSRTTKFNPRAWARAGGQGGSGLFPIRQHRHGGLRPPS